MKNNMKFKICIVLSVFLLLLMIGSVCADDSFTITVTEKHILGNGYSAYSGPLFILTDNHVSNSIGDVLVKSEDYYKIHLGDTVTVSMPDKYGYCNVLKINNQENTDNGWW